jgi:hypothetical protein
MRVRSLLEVKIPARAAGLSLRWYTSPLVDQTPVGRNDGSRSDHAHEIAGQELIRGSESD